MKRARRRRRRRRPHPAREAPRPPRRPPPPAEVAPPPVPHPRRPAPPPRAFCDPDRPRPWTTCPRRIPSPVPRPGTPPPGLVDAVGRARDGGAGKAAARAAKGAVRSVGGHRPRVLPVHVRGAMPCSMRGVRHRLRVRPLAPAPAPLAAPRVSEVGRSRGRRPPPSTRRASPRRPLLAEHVGGRGPLNLRDGAAERDPAERAGMVRRGALRNGGGGRAARRVRSSASLTLACPRVSCAPPSRPRTPGSRTNRPKAAARDVVGAVGVPVGRRAVRGPAPSASSPPPAPLPSRHPSPLRRRARALLPASPRTTRSTSADAPPSTFRPLVAAALAGPGSARAPSPTPRTRRRGAGALERSSLRRSSRAPPPLGAATRSSGSLESVPRGRHLGGGSLLLGDPRRFARSRRLDAAGQAAARWGPPPTSPVGRETRRGAAGVPRDVHPTRNRSSTSAVEVDVRARVILLVLRRRDSRGCAPTPVVGGRAGWRR